VSEPNGRGAADEAFWREVDEVLKSERPAVVAARRLHALAAGQIKVVAEGVHAPKGFGRDLVYRCIAVRTQATFASLLLLLEAGVGHSARVLLRPLSEDRIFLGWLGTLDEQTANEFVRLRTVFDAADGYEAQRTFLPEAYSLMQVDPVPPNARGMNINKLTGVKTKIAADLKVWLKAHGYGPRGPTVKAMAEAGKRTDEYDFFYLVSSRSVHANLHEMVRMVWGDPTSMVVSISNDQLAVIDFDLCQWSMSRGLSGISGESQAG
jgi:hypothetical protein